MRSKALGVKAMNLANWRAFINGLLVFLNMSENIEEFIKYDDRWIPCELESRETVSPVQTNICPRIRRMIGSYVVSKRIADLEIKNGNGEYCWNTCDRVDCPAYKDNVVSE